MWLFEKVKVISSRSATSITNSYSIGVSYIYNLFNPEINKKFDISRWMVMSRNVES